MQDFKVESVADKQATNGKPYKALEIKDSAGAVFKVNVFSEITDFANINVGYMLKGSLVQKGQYTNFISVTQAPKTGGGAFKQNQIEETMQRKETSIVKFQDNKDWSIKVSSTMRDAVQLALAEVKDIRTLNTLEADVLKWREWLWKNWDVKEDQYPPF